MNHKILDKQINNNPGPSFAGFSWKNKIILDPSIAIYNIKKELYDRKKYTNEQKAPSIKDSKELRIWGFARWIPHIPK